MKRSWVRLPSSPPRSAVQDPVEVRSRRSKVGFAEEPSECIRSVNLRSASSCRCRRDRHACDDRRWQHSEHDEAGVSWVRLLGFHRRNSTVGTLGATPTWALLKSDTLRRKAWARGVCGTEAPALVNVINVAKFSRGSGSVAHRRVFSGPVALHTGRPWREPARHGYSTRSFEPSWWPRGDGAPSRPTRDRGCCGTVSRASSWRRVRGREHPGR